MINKCSSSLLMVWAAISCLLGAILSPVQAATLPAGFSESIVLSGLTGPTAVRFSPDGRVFVTEKSGLIKVFANLSATTPTIFHDLRTNVHNFWDRGLMGLELHPNFPTVPSVYVIYTYGKDPNTPQEATGKPFQPSGTSRERISETRAEHPRRVLEKFDQQGRREWRTEKIQWAVRPVYRSCEWRSPSSVFRPPRNSYPTLRV